MTVDVVALLQAALARVDPYLTAKNQCYLAYSGGADSELLAWGLAQLTRSSAIWQGRVCLLHVHHGLSPNADAWAAHCQTQADRYGLPLRILPVQLQLGPRVSVEAEARRARYQAIAANMQAGDVLLTAHHQDDQLETLLLALKRGQGPKGLAAMGELQPFAQDCWQLRPLLGVTKDTLLQQLALLGLPHVHDESNDNTRYERNFLRHAIIPHLKARWPHITQTASRSAALCAEQQSLLDEVTTEKLQPLLGRCSYTGQRTLDITALMTMSRSWQRQLLRGYLLLCQLPAPSLVQLDETLAQLHHGQPDSAPCLQFGELELRRSFGLLYAMAPLGPLPHGQTLQVSLLQQPHQQWPLAAPLRGLQTAWVTEGPRLAAQALQAPLQLTYGLPGSTRCHPHYRQQARELKKVWQEAQVPVWLRPRLPIFVSGDKVLAIVGVFVDAASQAQDSAPGLQLSLQLS